MYSCEITTTTIPYAETKDELHRLQSFYLSIFPPASHKDAGNCTKWLRTSWTYPKFKHPSKTPNAVDVPMTGPTQHLHDHLYVGLLPHMYTLDK